VSSPTVAEAMRHYPLDPCRLDLGVSIHAALVALLPAGARLSLAAEDIGRLLEQPPEAHLGDYALPCFRFAKDLKKKPPEVAEALAQTLQSKTERDWLERTQVVGAFLNIFIAKQRLAETVLPDILSGASFNRLKATPGNTTKRVMIEFSQPNTHKEVHVGHGRNVCLGNSLVHLFRYVGYNVVAANYFGDEGTHIATVLSYMQRHGKTAPATERGAWLGEMYVAAKRELADADPATKAKLTEEISRVHRSIESKSGETYQLWLTTRQWSLDDFDRLYRWLNVKFDVLFYESEVSEAAQKIVDEFLAKGVFTLDQGAVGVDLTAQKLGFCILRKRDGNTLYATKDLALARRKFEQYKIDRNVYVVGDEQNHHFKQVFKVLELMGFGQAKQCFHLSYGMVVLPEGKMSSRDGRVVPFAALRTLVQDHIGKILEKYVGEWSSEEIETTKHRLTDGAIKYGMISTDPVKEIVFNVEDWVSFDGNSGPYLMYSYSRTQSILRKAAEAGYVPDAALASALTDATEHELLRYLFDFNQVVATACESLKPSLVATHLFYLCKAFNRFYAGVPVLKAEKPEQRLARLALVDAFGRTLVQGLALLGITPPERM